MDDWEWPREFWHLPPPWEAYSDEEAVDTDNEDEAEQFYSLAAWDEPEPPGEFLSLEELEEQEDEALWEEEFNLDHPMQLYLIMDHYAYLRQTREEEIDDLLEDDPWTDETSPDTKATSEDESSSSHPPDSEN